MADNIEKLLARVAEVKASKKFKSEREWCEKAGVSPSYVAALRSKHGTGEVKTVKMEHIAKLAHAAGVPVEWLMGADLSDADAMPKASHGALEAALETFVWPENLEPEVAGRVIILVRSEAVRVGAPMPKSYWHSRIKRAIAEKQRRPRD